MLTPEQQHYLDCHIKPIAKKIRRLIFVEMIEKTEDINGFVDRLCMNHTDWQAAWHEFFAETAKDINSNQEDLGDKKQQNEDIDYLCRISVLHELEYEFRTGGHVDVKIDRIFQNSGLT